MELSSFVTGVSLFGQGLLELASETVANAGKLPRLTQDPRHRESQQLLRYVVRVLRGADRVSGAETAAAKVWKTSGEVREFVISPDDGEPIRVAHRLTTTGGGITREKYVFRQGSGPTAQVMFREEGGRPGPESPNVAAFTELLSSGLLGSIGPIPAPSPATELRAARQIADPIIKLADRKVTVTAIQPDNSFGPDINAKILGLPKDLRKKLR